MFSIFDEAPGERGRLSLNATKHLDAALVCGRQPPRKIMQPMRIENSSQFAVRAMTVHDIPLGLRLCRASGWNQLEEDWKCFLEFEGGNCWLVEKGSSPSGTVAVLRYNTGFAWLAMMLVDSTQRGQGIGSLLMDTALAALDQFCVRLDATPAGAPLYRRYGFCVEYELARMKVSADCRRLTASDGSVRRIEAADLSTVLARDREVFGADRGDLLRVFYRLTPELAWMREQAGALQGYCFGRPGYLYSHIGPVVADGPSGASEILSACLASQTGGTFAIDVPQHSPAWIAWLNSCGFSAERPFLRMCRGGRGPWGLPEFQFGIAGPEFG